MYAVVQIGSSTVMLVVGMILSVLLCAAAGSAVPAVTASMAAQAAHFDRARRLTGRPSEGLEVCMKVQKQAVGSQERSGLPVGMDWDKNQSN